MSKNKFFLIYIIVITITTLINLSLTGKVDDTDESQLLEGIKKGLKDLLIPYSSDEDTITQKQYIKLFQHLILNDIDTFSELGANFIEDNLLFKLSKEITNSIPKNIKVKDLPKYLNPKMAEPLINKILEEINFASILRNIGDSFGIGEKIDKGIEQRKKMYEEHQRKKAEREKNEKKNNNNKDNNEKKVEDNNNNKEKININGNNATITDL